MNPLARAHRLALYAIGGLLLLTGAAWAVLHYFADERTAVPVTALLMKIHGGAAMIVLVLIGALIPQHVAGGWRLARNRASGLALTTLAGLLAVTGYLLYYAGSDAVHGSASLLHLAIGAGLPAALIAHRLR